MPPLPPRAPLVTATCPGYPGEEHLLLPEHLTMYNMCTLFFLAKARVFALLPQRTELQLGEEGKFVLPAPRGCRSGAAPLQCAVEGDPVAVPADRAQARAKMNALAGARSRLRAKIKEAVDIFCEEWERDHRVVEDPRVAPGSRTTPTTPPDPPPLKPQPTPPPGPPVPGKTSALNTTTTKVSAPAGTLPGAKGDAEGATSAPPPAAAATSYKCPMCKEMIPTANELLHGNFCSQNTKCCTVCGEYFPISAIDAHMEEAHTPHLCPNGCGEKFLKGALDTHVTRHCTHRRQKCDFCMTEVPMCDFVAHKKKCSATRVCSECHLYIPCCEWVQHLADHQTGGTFVCSRCQGLVLNSNRTTHDLSCRSGNAPAKTAVPDYDPRDFDDDFVWESRDPGTNNWMPYVGKNKQQIERAYRNYTSPGNNVARTKISINGKNFFIDFSKMQQENASGGTRKVRRRQKTTLELPRRPLPHAGAKKLESQPQPPREEHGFPLPAGVDDAALARLLHLEELAQMQRNDSDFARRLAAADTPPQQRSGQQDDAVARAVRESEREQQLLDDESLARQLYEQDLQRSEFD